MLSDGTHSVNVCSLQFLRLHLRCPLAVRLLPLIICQAWRILVLAFKLKCLGLGEEVVKLFLDLLFVSIEWVFVDSCVLAAVGVIGTHGIVVYLVEAFVPATKHHRGCVVRIRCRLELLQRALSIVDQLLILRLRRNTLIVIIRRHVYRLWREDGRIPLLASHAFCLGDLTADFQFFSGC